MTLIAEQPRIVTPEELLSLPDNNTMELVNGQIVEKNVGLESSTIEGLFYFRVQSFLVSHPIAEVFPASMGYRCFRDDVDRIRKRDMTVVRLEPLKTLTDPNPGYMPIVPDLAVEVVSPNDGVYELDAKVQEYHDAGFPLVWVADPKARTMTVYPLGAKPVIYTTDDELT